MFAALSGKAAKEFVEASRQGQIPVGLNLCEILSAEYVWLSPGQIKER
jgi:hypothetical protein